ncbi:Uncharacterized protein APZ42_025420 [Daphnia magna]|uniref:Uncharacterized protein n=1 Tax=Daphnia magna TaxID=35525 RepID=A0A164T3R6_9CRUS|nr:Uncharacterized protein APZ42_025420 [Daphnia magna]
MVRDSRLTMVLSMSEQTMAWKYILAEFYVEDRKELALVSSGGPLMKMLSVFKYMKARALIMDHAVSEDSWIEYVYRRLRVCDQSTFNGLMGEDECHYAVNASQFGEEGTSDNAAVAQTRNKRNVAVSGLDKSLRFASTNKIGQKEKMSQYSRANKGSGIKYSSTYDPSLASFSRKKLILKKSSKKSYKTYM